MNYLAHAYLSFGQPPVIAGNMISDFIKGKKQFDYPSDIQTGIRLHRAIDTFTDDHPATKAAKEFFKIPYRLYSGAFVDVVYDHFLANDRNEFSSEAVLASFSQNVYTVLENYATHLPPAFLPLLPYMKNQDWLYNYRLRSGMQKSFGGLVRRAAYLTEADTAFNIFNKHYDALQDCYNDFFKDVKFFSAHHLQQLQNID